MFAVPDSSLALCRLKRDIIKFQSVDAKNQIQGKMRIPMELEGTP